MCTALINLNAFGKCEGDCLTECKCHGFHLLLVSTANLNNKKIIWKKQNMILIASRNGASHRCNNTGSTQYLWNSPNWQRKRINFAVWRFPCPLFRFNRMDLLEHLVPIFNYWIESHYAVECEVDIFSHHCSDGPHTSDRFLHTIDWLLIDYPLQRHKSSESQQKHVSRLLNDRLCVAHTVQVHVLRNSDSLCRWRELYAQNECSIIVLNTDDGVGGIAGILHVTASVQMISIVSRLLFQWVDYRRRDRVSYAVSMRATERYKRLVV